MNDDRRPSDTSDADEDAAHDAVIAADDTGLVGQQAVIHEVFLEDDAERPVV